MAKRKNIDEMLQNKGDAITSAEEEIGAVGTVEDESSSSATREDRIRDLAYAKAESRGFQPGGETDDWLAAEREIG